MAKYVLIMEGKAIKFVEIDIDYDIAMKDGLSYQGEPLKVGCVEEVDSTTGEPVCYYYAAHFDITIDESVKFKVLQVATS